MDLFKICSKCGPWLFCFSVFFWLVPVVQARQFDEVPKVEIHGNKVIVDEVYHAIIKMPAKARANRATARLIRKQLLQFLHRAGYSLATAKAGASGDTIHIDLNEGRLQKIVYLGCGTLRALQLKLSVNLPHHVFNRPYLVRQLKQLSKKYGIAYVSYRLVRTEKVAHQGPQFDDLGGDLLFPLQASHQLHIKVGRGEWDVGLDMDLEFDFPDGLTFGTNYQNRGFLFAEDRWRFGGRAGAKLRERLEGSDPYLALSRAQLEWKWFTPPLIGKGFKSYLWFKSNLVSRQRADLDAEIYYTEDLEASLHFGYEIAPGMMISVGGGADQRYLFGIEQLSSATHIIEPSARFQPFAMGKVDLVLDTKDLRRDRRHVLMLEGRHYWVEGTRELGKVMTQYRKVFAFGWHDLWLKTRMTWLWGNVTFDNEEPVGGRYVRGVFGNKFYVRRVGNLSLEFRMSLARDLFKFSLFHDLAVFGELDRDDDSEQISWADSLGVGFHALILDLFQLNLYYSFGFASDGGFDQGLSASLRKVF